MLIKIMLIKHYLILFPFCQYLVSLMEAKLGWMCVFYFFIAMVGQPHFCFCVWRVSDDFV